MWWRKKDGWPDGMRRPQPVLREQVKHLMALMVPLTEGPDGALDPAHSSSATQTASAVQTMASFGSSS